MSKEIDWSKAPADATHYLPGDDDNHECWLKSGFAVRLDRNSHDWFSDFSTHRKIEEGLAIPRPATPSWSGEGVPPVGIDIEVLHELYGWIGARVVGQDGEAAIVRTNDGYAGVFQHQIRPIRTPEQIAADERDKAAHELFRSAWPETHSWGDLSPHWQEAFYRLADAGYRKP